jgi:poly(hydroxyalkanoate) depolymerase family esterase
MINRPNRTLLNVLLFTLVPIISSELQAGTYKEVTNFGANPSNIKMFLYTPDTLATKPPVLVACHWCHGKADDIYNGARYVSFADKFGYYVIFPSAVSSDGCWDVASTGALSHDGGGDPLGIVSMVRYVLKNFNADSTRVYALGVSSGAMMTNVLLGAYPDVFSAGCAFAGVPFGCFAGPNSWNDDCAKGNIIKTPQQWGDLVRAAFPGYTGKRPKLQLWHGSNDEVLNYRNLGETVKQWTNLFGIDTVPSSTQTNVYQSGWTRRQYTNAKNEIVVETITEQGVSHNLQVLQEEALAFLGLDKKATGQQSACALKRGVRSATAVVSTKNSADRITITVRSAPGQAAMSLFTVNGARVYSLPDAYSQDGMYTFSVSRNKSVHPVCASGLYIMKVLINGTEAGAFRLTM